MKTACSAAVIDETAKKKSPIATQKVKTDTCSPTLSRQTSATATSLLQVASSEIRSLENDEAEFHPMHMDWVPVADTKGDPRPRMHWRFD